MGEILYFTNQSDSPLIRTGNQPLRSRVKVHNALPSKCRIDLIYFFLSERNPVLKTMEADDYGLAGVTNQHQAVRDKKDATGHGLWYSAAVDLAQINKQMDFRPRQGGYYGKITHGQPG